MARRDLIERVLAGLPAMSDSVAYPDHPLLLRGPDILASIDSRLTAYFLLDRPVHRIPVRLLSDVVLSRLALPRETSFVLILGPDAEIRGSDADIFEEIAEISSNQLASFPVGRIPESRTSEAINSLRRPHNDRFGKSWVPARRPRDGRHGDSEMPTSILRYEAKMRYRGSRYMDFGNGKFTVASPEQYGQISSRDLLDRAIHAAVQADYWLDLGVPGVAEVAQVMQRPDTYLAMHTSLLPLPTSVRQFDVLKPFRAAAFAGFSIKRGVR